LHADFEFSLKLHSAGVWLEFCCFLLPVCAHLVMHELFDIGERIPGLSYGPEKTQSPISITASNPTAIFAPIKARWIVFLTNGNLDLNLGQSKIHHRAESKED
jgi:hypothetical protein